MSDITKLPQRMEEVDPRDAFEKQFPLPVFCIRCGDGYASTSFNGWDANKHKARWEGWKAAMALMESRTVTVKLPDYADNGVGETWDDGFNSGIDSTCDALRSALTAAGIKLEIE